MYETAAQIAGDEQAGYEICTGTGTDSELQLVARDRDAQWLVVESSMATRPRVLEQGEAEGEVAYHRGLLGHPSWCLRRDSDTAVHVFPSHGQPFVIGHEPEVVPTDDRPMDGILHRSVLETASWRLAAELCRRHPGQLRVYETHPGGGQYDCLTLARTGEGPGGAIAQLNRHGSIHVVSRADGSPSDAARWEWADYLQAQPYRFMRDVEEAAGLAPPPTTPTTVAHTLVYRLLAASVSTQTLGVRGRTVVSGYLDTSSWECSTREELFARFPGTRRHRADETLERPLDVAEYRFWFVVDGEEPLACFDIAGRGWDTDGNEYEVMSVYRRCNRRLGSTLAKVSPRLLS